MARTPAYAEQITFQAICDRVFYLLQAEMPTWYTNKLFLLAQYLGSIVVDYGQKGHLGPLGLSTVNEISTSIGHENLGRYMCLTVNAPGSGNVQVLLKGGLCQKDGRDPVHCGKMMELCRRAFEVEAEKKIVFTLPAPTGPTQSGRRR